MKCNRYKHILSGVLSFVFPFMGTYALSPSTNQNSIITYTPNRSVSSISNTADSVSCPVVQYFDGFGRPVQTVAVGSSPSGNDLVSNTEYDSFGRLSKTWLPYVSSGSGAFVGQSVITNALPAYYGDATPYSLDVYDGSPLNRVIKEYGPGENWQNAGKGVDHFWYANDQSDSLVVNKYVLQSDGLIKTGTYDNATLYVTCQIDEDGHKTWTFTDKLGHTVLTRTYTGSTYCSTYYVYNDLNQLVYVLPPLASDALTANNVFWNIYTSGRTTILLYCYFYRYDSRGNCIEKRLPGILSQYMVYDKTNRLVLSQDGNQRAGKHWTFTKYDALGRLIMHGSIVIPTSQSLLVSAYKDSCIIESFNGNTSNYGYSNNHFSGREMLNEINYYDNYSLINSSWMPGSRTSYLSWQSSPLDARFINATDDNLSAKGLMTGSISFLSTNQLSKKYAVYYYDKNGRVVQKNATNHFNPISNVSFGGDQYAYSYDFKGNVLHVRHKHRGTYAGTIFIEGAKSEYDHAGRLIATKQYVSSESSAVTTSRNAYNELGQLSTKVYGNNLETQTYNYNIRGWLKEINGDMFAEKLYYERNATGVDSCYNGNIVQSSWKRLTGNTHTSGWKSNQSQWKENWSTYTYAYDKLNRMSSATLDGFTEAASYDKQGNITSLVRSGITESNWEADGMTPNHTTAIIDNLTNIYNGNQLFRASDYSSGSQLFTGGQDFKEHSILNYTYDSNGNLNNNFDKNITSTHYNFLNLPDTLQMCSGHMVTYGYDDATGVKTFVTRKTATGSTASMPIGSTLLNNTLGYTIASTDVTTYLDNIVHETSTYYLDKVMISDGMLKRTNAITETTPVLKYHYFLKDHLGNVRVVFDEDGIIKQVNNYYPFGMEWGESAEDQTSMTYQNNLFGGKEFDRKFELNMYDSGARNYDGTIGRWTTPDPHAENYYSVSPYAYCSNNPINKIDPTGMDEWDLDSLGNFVNHVVTDKHDAFYVVGANGKRVDGKSRTYAYGTVKDYGTKTADVVDEETGETKTYSYDYYSIEGDDKAKDLFEFLANPGATTKVEWTRLAYGEEGSQGMNNLTTTHQEKMEAGGMSLYYENLQNGANVRIHSHNHPGGTTAPGVLDRKNAALPIQLDYPDAKMYIYTVPQVYKLYYGVYPLKQLIIRPK